MFKTKKASLNLYATNYITNGKFYEFRMDNSELLDIDDSIKAMFNTLINNETFRNFGINKIVFITALFNGTERSLHSNIHMTNDTTFDQYYAKVSDYISKHYEEGYKVEVIDEFIIKVWKIDELVNTNIKIEKTNTILNNITIQPKKKMAFIQNKHGAYIRVPDTLTRLKIKVTKR
jgi:hypothetical protein